MGVFPGRLSPGKNNPVLWTLMSYGTLGSGNFWDYSTLAMLHCLNSIVLNHHCYIKSLCFIFTGLPKVFCPVLWLLQRPENNWLAQVPHAPVLLTGWIGQCGLQLHGGH